MDTVGTALTNLTEQIFLDDEMADTEDVKTSIPEIPTVSSLKRQ